jgi:hypothetical protein
MSEVVGLTTLHGGIVVVVVGFVSWTMAVSIQEKAISRLLSWVVVDK